MTCPRIRTAESVSQPDTQAQALCARLVTIHYKTADTRNLGRRLGISSYEVCRYGVAFVSAGPAVDMRITDPGLEVVVRHITRASERAEVRSRLNHAIIKLLRRGEAVATA